MYIILAAREAEIKRITVRGQLRQKVGKTLFPNNQSKMDGGCGLSSRAPVLQGQCPEFKPQACQKQLFLHTYIFVHFKEKNVLPIENI
jgi:hypothetical protein